MFDSTWFILLGLLVNLLICCLPAMAINNLLDGTPTDDEPSRRGGRKPSPRRGLPDNKSLLDLARTYLEAQHRHWPALVRDGILPPLTSTSISSLADEFKHRFLDRERRLEALPFLNQHVAEFGAAYLRFSSESSNPRSLAQQLVNCLDRARRDEVFIPWMCVCADAAVSGTLVQRRGYQMAKHIMTSRDISVATMYIDELGRAARYAIEALRLGQLLVASKKRLVGATDGFDTDNPHYKLMLHVYAMLHEWYVDQLRSKVHRGMRDAFDQGVDITRCAFGYKMDVVLDSKKQPVLKANGKPQRVRVIDEEKAKYVREAFNLFVEKQWSPNQIAAHFNDLNAGGRATWAYGPVASMLEREVYDGFEFRYKTRQIQDPETSKVSIIKRPRSEWKRRDVPHLRIIEHELWIKAQARLKECRDIFADKRPNGMGRGSAYPKTLLRPVCWSCGRELVLGHSGKSPSFCCPNGRDRKHGCKFSGYKSVSIVEAVILDTVLEHIVTADFRERLVGAANGHLKDLASKPKEDVLPVKSKLKKLKLRQERLAEAIAECGSARVAALVKKLDQCENEIAAVRKRLKDMRLQNEPLPPTLTVNDIQQELDELPKLLNSEKAIAAPVLRALIAPVVVEQIKNKDNDRPTWIAKFTINSGQVLAEIARRRKSPIARCLDLLNKRGWKMPVTLEVPLIRKTKYEKLGLLFKSMVDAGTRTIDELATEYKFSKELVKRIVEFGATGKRRD
jgi:DNA invertase Pin-like site-specific DNA recombinase